MSLLSKISIGIAKQWIAGTTVEDAIKVGHELNKKKQHVTINYLGEEFDHKSEVEKSVKIILRLMEMMSDEKIEGDVSLKATQLGIVFDKKLFLKNYSRIATYAKNKGIFVWLDMEEYKYVDFTIKSYLRNLRSFKNIGICIQAKLERSYNDAKEIASKKGVIRLVKGAYSEPEEISYRSRKAVRSNYLIIMDYLIRHNVKFMVATHDEQIIEKALEESKKYRRNIIFGMLRGVRGNFANELAKKGKQVNIYVPFGENWLEYSSRRLKEEGHALLIVRSIFQQ